jgi:hypothetical protein
MMDWRHFVFYSTILILTGGDIKMKCEDCLDFIKKWGICKLLGDRPDLPCPKCTQEAKDNA